MTRHVKIAIDAGILTLTLARAEKKNALTNGMYGALADALEQAEGNPAIRVVLIRAEGESFTAGNDIGEFAAQASGRIDGVPEVMRFLHALAHASRPLVAAVQGHAVGVGTTMLLHCDVVLLAEDARLSTPFVSLALVPEAAASLLLPQRIGHPRAFAMFALGQVVDAATALAWGLANQVVPSGDLHHAAHDMAVRLAGQPAQAMAATKRLMRDAATLSARIDVEGVRFAEQLRSPEAREAFAAFAERRAPDFTKIAG